MQKVVNLPLVRIILAILFVGIDLVVTQLIIFGVGSSGSTGETIRGLLQAKLIGPVFLSGGTAGVEASLLSVLI